MAKPEVTCTSSFCCNFFFLQNIVSTLIFIDILWPFYIKQLFHSDVLPLSYRRLVVARPSN